MGNNATQQKLFEAIQTALEAVMNVDRADVRKDTDLVRELGMESIDFIDIQNELSNALSVHIDLTPHVEQQDARGMTVQRLMDVISAMA